MYPSLYCISDVSPVFDHCCKAFNESVYGHCRILTIESCTYGHLFWQVGNVYESRRNMELSFFGGWSPL